MLNIQNQKLRYWILSGYSIPVILLIISGIIVWWNAKIVRQESRALNRSSEISQKIDTLALDIQVFSRATRGYLLDKSPVSLDSVQQSRQTFNQAVQEVGRLLQNPEQIATFQELVEEVKALESINNELVSLVQQGKSEQAIQRWKQADGRVQSEQIEDLLRTFRAREQTMVAESEQLQKEALDHLTWAIIGAIACSLILTFILGSWIVSAIANRMNQAAGSVASSSTEIAATIDQQERAATQQAASVNETTTTMDELGASSRQMTQQADDAAASAREAFDRAEDGTRAVERTLDGMEQLRDKVGAMQGQILRLSDQTNQIGNISTLVSDLANQTNMLALNAAVEAVRAGEHGKGFSVVAAEIRKLADESRKSAEKINALVEDVQTAINSTVMVTEEGTKTVETGVRIARDTSEAFAAVQESVNNVVLNNQQISLNIKQQVSAIQQVVEAMNTINAAAQEAANGISQIKIGTQNLNDAATNLKEIV